MAGDSSRRRVRRRLVWATIAFVPVLAIGLFVAVAFEARDRLPELLAWVVREFVPGVELQVASARLESRNRFVATGVAVKFEDAATAAFEATRVEVDFALSEVWEGRVRAVHVNRPQIMWTGETRGAGGPGPAEASVETGGGFGWSIDRLSARDGHLEVSHPSLPEVVLDFELALEDVGDTEASTGRVRTLAVTNLRLGPDEHPLVRSPRVEAELSWTGARRGRLERLQITQPQIDLSATLPKVADENADEDGSAEGTFVIGHLVVQDAHVKSPPAGQLPGLEARFGLDLRDVGDAPPLADRTQTVDVTDVRVTTPGPAREPMMKIARLSADVSVAGLLQRRAIGALRVPVGSLLLDAHGRAFLLGENSEPSGASGGTWTIGTLEIGTLAVHLAELGPPLPDVTFDVHTTLTDLPLSAAAAEIADDAQELELASLALYSPFDPFKKVVTVGSVFVDFTLAGLARQTIDEVKLLRPTIYLAEDLFWYMTNERADATSSPSSPWTIDLLKAELGSLILEIGKARRVGLPITFETQVRDVKLDNLADLKLAAELHVPEESYRFPDYDVDLERVHGQLQFDYPPGEGSENFVSTLYADAFTWRDYSLEKGWLSLTFDPKGINGTFGGAGYDGYVNGGITVPYAFGEPWVGWVSASEIDLTELTAVIAGGAVEMTGPLDANIALTIANQTLETAEGDLVLAKPGRLEFTRLDESQIPKGWASWQRDLGKIALEALKNFEYDAGQGKLDFERGVGLATLDLKGPDGGRRLEVHYHGDGGDPLSLDVRVASREDGE